MMWLAKNKASTPLLDTSQTPEWSVLFEQLAEQAQD
ncbi:3'-5' exonuclease, partial [Vibrio alginolyticus]|nr:3'-5' exonuclease [Vibrio alginolyticus]MDW2089692.1 3'-5' exonuclease [Vibrio sp. 2134-1]